MQKNTTTVLISILGVTSIVLVGAVIGYRSKTIPELKQEVTSERDRSKQQLQEEIRRRELAEEESSLIQRELKAIQQEQQKIQEANKAFEEEQLRLEQEKKKAEEDRIAAEKARAAAEAEASKKSKAS